MEKLRPLVKTVRTAVTIYNRIADDADPWRTLLPRLPGGIQIDRNPIVSERHPLQVGRQNGPGENGSGK